MSGIKTVDVEAFCEEGQANGVERFVTVDWVAHSSDGFPDDAPTSAPTRDALVEELVERFDGDRECVEHKLTHGDLFIRQRVVVSAWANDEDEAPSLWWVSNLNDATDLATAERERDEARAELASMRADLAALTARVEAEIAAAAEAVRSRTIAECIERVRVIEAAERERAHACFKNSYLDAALSLASSAAGIAAARDAIAALAAPQPAPTEPADVDPAAGALR